MSEETVDVDAERSFPSAGRERRMATAPLTWKKECFRMARTIPIVRILSEMELGGGNESLVSGKRRHIL